MPGVESLLAGPESTPAVLLAYELDKALYELDYERAHRPGMGTSTTRRCPPPGRTEEDEWP